MSKIKTIRRKTKQGVTGSFRYRQFKDDGKWKVVAAGALRCGRNPLPCAFAPFEILDAVFKCPRFDTEQQVRDYIYAL